MSRRSFALVIILLAAAGTAAAQEAPPQTGSVVSDAGLSAGGGRFRVKAEVKVNARDSRDVTFTVRNAQTPFPIELRTVSPTGGFEISNVALTLEADITPQIGGRAVVHFLDLYNRNPTSSDDRVFVREAWLRFGKKQEPLQAIPGTGLYLQLGKAPRFTKQVQRRLESYGLWGTAVGRFEEIGLEAGGSFGTHVYWRAAVANGNPLFMRDANALAGDNGTPERTIGSSVPVVYQSGFPILYDAKANDTNFSGSVQAGGGLGFRFLGGEEERRWGVDVVVWYFHRTLQARVPIRGSFYSGDLRLLQGSGGAAPALPARGDTKEEWGGNLEARWGRLQLYVQGVHQEIAGLERYGAEAELAYRFPLNGLFVSGDAPVLNWLQPVVRYSRIVNNFEAAGFVAPSFFWDWTKLDFGFRLGIVRGIDLTAEYSRHSARTRLGLLHPDEFLTTLRLGF